MRHLDGQFYFEYSLINTIDIEVRPKEVIPDQISVPSESKWNAPGKSTLDPMKKM